MTAEQVLINSGITSLPVDLGKIAVLNRIKIVSYESCAECYDMDIERLYKEVSALGFSFRAGEHYVAAVNRNACGKQRRRWTIAHELAHILLGHVNEGIGCRDEGCERDADSFAGELLAPLSVLHFCCVSSAEEIARLCGLSKQAAEIRFRQLTSLRRSNSQQWRGGAQSVFLRSGEERILLEQFLPFIAEYITRRTAHDGYEQYLKRIKGHDMAIE